MEIFNAIGLEIPKGKTLNDLAEDAEMRGEASLSTRPSCKLHGRCWRIGQGLEVWTILYESEIGEIFYADCRPGFRARHTQNISCWVLHEDEEEGEAAVEGRTEDYGANVFFQLQNLTEVGTGNFKRDQLTVGLGGLAHRAEVLETDAEYDWTPLYKTEGNSDADETDWRLCGKVLEFKLISNPFSGKTLYWIHLDLERFELEILVNQQTLSGGVLRVGASIKADVWLQGHIVSQSTFYSSYEGVDRSQSTIDFWKQLKKVN